MHVGLFFHRVPHIQMYLPLNMFCKVYKKNFVSVAAKSALFGNIPVLLPIGLLKRGVLSLYTCILIMM